MKIKMNRGGIEIGIGVVVEVGVRVVVGVAVLGIRISIAKK